MGLFVVWILGPGIAQGQAVTDCAPWTEGEHRGWLAREGSCFEAHASGTARLHSLVWAGDADHGVARLSRDQGRVCLRDPSRWFAVQLITTGRRGPLPAAVCVLGRRRPVRRQGTVQRWIAEEREAVGQPRLRPNRLLARAARDHARAVCARGEAVHGGKGDDPWARLARQGLGARAVGEVVGLGRGEGAIVTRLRQSPSHVVTVRTHAMTDVGVGRWRTDTGACVVALLASWPAVGAGHGCHGGLRRDRGAKATRRCGTAVTP